MKFGLIGYGAWGKLHAEAIAKAPGAELAAIACSRAESVEEASSRYPDLTVTDDYRRLLEDASLEAVDIVVPTHLHAEIGIAALEAGKNVLLEKPMAASVEECDRLIEAAERSGSLLSIGHEFRLSSQWSAVKEAIDRGEIGTPLYALVSLFRFPYRKGSGGWRYDRARVGSWILEEPIHFFDFVQWFLAAHGDPTSVTAYGNAIAEVEGLYDNFTSILKYPNGAYAVVTQSLAGFQHHQLVEVTGTAGSVRTTWSGVMDRTASPETRITIRRAGTTDPAEVELSAPSGELFELNEELRRTVDSFRSGHPLYSPTEARKLVKICLEAERSLREGREIELSF